MKKIFLGLLFVLLSQSVHARYFDPEGGRFINRDPLEYVDGMNLYAGYFAQRFQVDPMGTIRTSIDAAIEQCFKRPTPGQIRMCLETLIDACAKPEHVAKVKNILKAFDKTQDLLKSAAKLTNKQAKKLFKDVHKAKDIIKKQYRKELGANKNFDLLIDKAGNVVLEGNKTGIKILTNLPPSAFVP